MESKTVKELREIAKEMGIVGRWEMSKQELIEAINAVQQSVNEGDDCAKRTPQDYLQNIGPGTLVAFKRNKNKDVAMSGKFVGFENGRVLIESKKGTLFKVSPDNVIWVKSGGRWPKWVYSLFNNKEREVESDNAIS